MSASVVIENEGRALLVNHHPVLYYAQSESRKTLCNNFVFLFTKIY